MKTDESNDCFRYNIPVFCFVRSVQVRLLHVHAERVPDRRLQSRLPGGGRTVERHLLPPGLPQHHSATCRLQGRRCRLFGTSLAHTMENYGWVTLIKFLQMTHRNP